jgi:hypothetical protein
MTEDLRRVTRQAALLDQPLLTDYSNADNQHYVK